MKNRRRILVFSAHVSDEIAGAGGTLAKLASRGVDVRVVTFAAGGPCRARDESKGGNEKQEVQGSASSDSILGIQKHINLGKPSEGVENTAETFLECVQIIRKNKPDIILSHYHKDRHRDHRSVSRIVEEARWKAGEDVLKQLGNPWQTKRMYFFEMREVFTNPSMLVDVTSSFCRKIEAMKANTRQSEASPSFLDYLTGLAMARGYLMGCRYAEAFLGSSFSPSLE